MELQSVEHVETLDKDSFTSSLTRLGAWNLYISHALSTWNIRTYEFAAVSLHSCSLLLAYISKCPRLSSRHMHSLILYLLRRYGKPPRPRARLSGTDSHEWPLHHLCRTLFIFHRWELD